MSSYPSRIEAKTGWIHRVLTGGLTGVTFEADALRIEGPVGSPPEKIGMEEVDALTLRRSWFRRRLTILATGRVKRSIGGLDFRADQIYEAVMRMTTQRAEDLKIRLKQLDVQITDLLRGERYVRHSVALEIHDDLVGTVRGCGGLVRKGLQPEAIAVLGRLEPLRPVDRFEAARFRANDRFVRRSVPIVRAAADQALPVSVTDEQAEAIATDEDVTLVLAGAGTGKTATIVGKVVHLVRNEHVEPHEILVLAYNKKAVEEIRQRLCGDDLSNVDVSTFHAFGRQIISSQAVAPTISKLASDSNYYTLKREIEGIVGSMLTDTNQQDSVIEFAVYHNKPYQSAFDFGTQSEYDDYVRNTELRTLNQEPVRSFEELVIANYLAEHDIEYQYEEPYEFDTATRQHGQYRPDFYLPQYGIYIEHFALDKRGNPPSKWTGYAEGVKWKRNVHNQNSTTLIETYSWMHKSGTLRHELRERLEAKGVVFRSVSRERLLQQIAGIFMSWLTSFLAVFLNRVKTSDVSHEELRRRARSLGDRLRNESFLTIFEYVRGQYERALEDEGAIDFHDMINDAARYLHDGREAHLYRYVLVDEFQDISMGRMRLLESLRKWYPNTAYFLVGDDWQSIYRFAGSEVRLVREVQEHRSGLGYASSKVLSLTWLFGNEGGVGVAGGGSVIR